MSQFTFPPVTISSVGVDYEKANAATALPSTLAIIGGWTGTAITALKTAADGALQIDVESGHGLATEAKQDTIEATLTAIETDADTIAGAVSGTEMQVDIVASLPAGTNEIGKLAAGTASIGTVVLGAGTANIGALTAGTAEIGKLAAGTASIGSVTLNANSGVDIGDVDITSVVPGVGATNLGKAIQSAQGTTDTGVPALVVRNDTLADLSGADGDYAPLQVNASGALYTALAAGTASIGTVVLGAGTAEIGKLAAGTASIGTVILGAGTAEVGKLAAGTASIGTVILGTGSAQIGKLAANSGVDIGDVDVTSMPADSKNYVWKEGLDSTIGGISNGILDCSTTNIPSGTQLTVATLSNDVYEIQTVEDIGEFMGIYAGSNLKAILPLGGGNVKINLPSTTVVKLASFSGTAISSGNIAINFLG